MHLLRGAVWTYAWCADRDCRIHRTTQVPQRIPKLSCGWGAHPGDPTRLVTGEGEQPLLDTLLDDPDGRPGATARGRFDDTVPFLMMVLAADEPLSLQAHPSAAQAVGGFAREERSGIPVRLGAQLAIQYVRSGSKTVAAEARTVLELGERYPGDAGVPAALLLNRLSLQPGEAVYLPAGNLHTYLQGVAVEVMANSDNVLRGGLTNTWTRDCSVRLHADDRLRCVPNHQGRNNHLSHAGAIRGPCSVSTSSATRRRAARHHGRRSCCTRLDVARQVQRADAGVRSGHWVEPTRRSGCGPDPTKLVRPRWRPRRDTVPRSRDARGCARRDLDERDPAG